MAEDDPPTCVPSVQKTATCWICLDGKDLKDWPREKKFARMLRQAFKAKQKNAMKCKFGIGIPRNFREAVGLDKENGNAIWQDALKKEMDQTKACKAFTDLGKGARIPKRHMCTLFGIANLI
mgnify:CR=1 FL=1